MRMQGAMRRRAVVLLLLRSTSSFAQCPSACMERNWSECALPECGPKCCRYWKARHTATGGSRVAANVGQLPRPEGRPAGLEIRSAAEARSLPWVHVAAGIVVKLHSIYGLWAPALQLRREAMPVDPLSQLPPLPQTRVRSTMGKLVAAGAVVTHTVHGRSSIDRAIRSYLESSQRPEWWALYADATVPHVARSDLGRYALLYEEGGLYMDIDAELLTEGAAVHQMCGATHGGTHSGW